MYCRNNRLLMLLLATLDSALCQYYLTGIGYREQELQVAKGVNFNSESATGVPQASFAGGTHIFIKCEFLGEMPEQNVIILYSQDLQLDIPAPMLSEDDQFNSNPAIGTIAYRLPSISELFGKPMADFDHFD